MSLLTRRHPWYSGSALNYKPTGRASDPAPGAWFITNSSHSPRLSPAQYSLNSAESWPKTPIISYDCILKQWCLLEVEPEFALKRYHRTYSAAIGGLLVQIHLLKCVRFEWKINCDTCHNYDVFYAEWGDGFWCYNDGCLLILVLIAVTPQLSYPSCMYNYSLCIVIFAIIVQF